MNITTINNLIKKANVNMVSGYLKNIKTYIVTQEDETATLRFIVSDKQKLETLSIILPVAANTVKVLGQLTYNNLKDVNIELLANGNAIELKDFNEFRQWFNGAKEDVREQDLSQDKDELIKCIENLEHSINEISKDKDSYKNADRLIERRQKIMAKRKEQLETIKQNDTTKETYKINKERNSYKKIIKLGFTINEDKCKLEETRSTTSRAFDILSEGKKIGEYVEQINEYGGCPRELMSFIEFIDNDEVWKVINKKLDEHDEKEEEATHALTSNEVVEENDNNQEKESNNKDLDTTTVDYITEEEVKDDIELLSLYKEGLKIEREEKEFETEKTKGVYKSVVNKDLEEVRRVKVFTFKDSKHGVVFKHVEKLTHALTSNEVVEENDNNQDLDTTKEETKAMKAIKKMGLDIETKPYSDTEKGGTRYNIINNEGKDVGFYVEKKGKKAFFKITKKESVKDESNKEETIKDKTKEETKVKYDSVERANKVVKVVTGKDLDTTGMTFGDFLNMLDGEEEEEVAQVVEQTLEAQLELVKKAFLAHSKDKEVKELIKSHEGRIELYNEQATNERRQSNTRGANHLKQRAAILQQEISSMKREQLTEEDEIVL